MIYREGFHFVSVGKYNTVWFHDRQMGRNCIYEKMLEKFSSSNQGSPWVYHGFGVFLNRLFYSPLLCDQNEPLVMPNGQVLAKLWSKEIRKKFLLTVAHNTIIFPTNTMGKKLQVVCKTLCDSSTNFTYFNS